MTNTLAYYDMELINAEKKLRVQHPRADHGIIHRPRTF
jgi:hypothetical protein